MYVVVIVFFSFAIVIDAFAPWETEAHEKWFISIILF